MTDLTKPKAEIWPFSYLSVQALDQELFVTFDPPDDPVRAHSNRFRTARRLFLKTMIKLGGSKAVFYAEVPTFVFAPTDRDVVDVGCSALDQRLRAVFDEPLPAKRVDALLAITSSERRRWTKDGRLPPMGTLSSSRTQHNFNVPIFSVELIRRLVQQPEVIARWREADAADRTREGSASIWD